MNFLAALWFGGTAALVGWLAVRCLQEVDEVRSNWQERRLNRENDRRLAEWQARQQRFLRDLAGPAPLPRLQESKEGVFIRASCEAEAAEVLYELFCKPVRVA